MKKILMILAVVALGSIILSIVFNRAEPLLGLLGIGGLGLGRVMGGGKPNFKSAREIGKEVEQNEKLRYNSMSDKEVMDEVRKYDPSLATALDNRQSARLKQFRDKNRGSGTRLVRSIFKSK